MLNFEPNKRHLREFLIYFNLKKSAAEAHRLFVEAYGEAALNERSCEWFQKFKNGEFDVEDKERSGRPKVYENAELEALLNEDSCQTQKELALTFLLTSIKHYVSFFHNKYLIFDKKRRKLICTPNIIQVI
ncbi:Mariner Mos1 transposase [Acromyrmex echinatior]|uniref:Mariner Mos1 transposase n=1 Tax=Acromyrmex echinatior TaxID=103372 RepID=F4WHM4_ACREC|nr:Mariner Mos1 transposase [Acromyrmex echinatior]